MTGRISGGADAGDWKGEGQGAFDVNVSVVRSKRIGALEGAFMQAS